MTRAHSRIAAALLAVSLVVTGGVLGSAAYADTVIDQPEVAPTAETTAPAPDAVSTEPAPTPEPPAETPSSPEPDAPSVTPLAPAVAPVSPATPEAPASPVTTPAPTTAPAPANTPQPPAAAAGAPTLRTAVDDASDAAAMTSEQSDPGTRATAIQPAALASEIEYGVTGNDGRPSAGSSPPRSSTGKTSRSAARAGRRSPAPPARASAC